MKNITKMNQVKFGIVGTGNIASRFVESLPFTASARAESVFSRSKENTRVFAQKYRIPRAHTSLEHLLNDDIDAVYIATPHKTHASISLAALNAGKAVLCEKPSATSVGDLETVLTLAASKKLLYMEAMKPPFFPLFRMIRNKIETGEIGDIRFVRCGFANPNASPDSAVFDVSQAGGGLFDIGIYGAFLAIDFLGPFTSHQTLGRIGPTGVDTFASVNGLHANGISQIYCGLDCTGSGDAIIAGTLGHVRIQEKWWNPTFAAMIGRNGRTEELRAEVTGNGLNFEVDHFCELLNSNKIESPIMPHVKSRSMLSLICSARADLGLTR